MSIVSSALGVVTGGAFPLGAVAAVGGIALTLSVGAAAFFHEHDAKLVAQVAAQQAVVAAAAQHSQDQRTIAGLAVAAQKTATRAATTTKLKEAINATNPTTACATAPAIRALIDGLRSGPGSGHADPAPAAPGGRVAVSSPAPAAVR